jgi:hypothetical protein
MTSQGAHSLRPPPSDPQLLHRMSCHILHVCMHFNKFYSCANATVMEVLPRQPGSHRWYAQCYPWYNCKQSLVKRGLDCWIFFVYREKYVISWKGTALQAWRSRVQEPMRWVISAISLILPAALRPGVTKPLTEMSTRDRYKSIYGE